MLWAEPSDLIFCDFSTSDLKCKVAAEGLSYPNGKCLVGAWVFSSYLADDRFTDL